MCWPQRQICIAPSLKRSLIQINKNIILKLYWWSRARNYCWEFHVLGFNHFLRFFMLLYLLFIWNYWFWSWVWHLEHIIYHVYLTNANLMFNKFHEVLRISIQDEQRLSSVFVFPNSTCKYGDSIDRKMKG